MLLAAMLIDAFHAALEDRIVVLCRVRMGITTNVFLVLVDNRTVARKFLSDLSVVCAFVGHQRGFPRDVCANYRRDMGSAHASGMEAAHRPPPSHKAENDVFVPPSAMAMACALPISRR